MDNEAPGEPTAAAAPNSTVRHLMMFGLLLALATPLGALAAGLVYLVDASTAAFSEYRCDGCQAIFLIHLETSAGIALIGALVSVVPLAAVLRLLRIRTSLSAPVILLSGALVSDLVLASGTYLPLDFDQLWSLVAPGLLGSAVFVLVLLPVWRSRHLVRQSSPHRTAAA